MGGTHTHTHTSTFCSVDKSCLHVPICSLQSQSHSNWSSLINAPSNSLSAASLFRLRSSSASSLRFLASSCNFLQSVGHCIITIQFPQHILITSHCTGTGEHNNPTKSWTYIIYHQHTTHHVLLTFIPKCCTKWVEYKLTLGLFDCLTAGFFCTPISTGWSSGSFGKSGYLGSIHCFKETAIGR